MKKLLTLALAIFMTMSLLAGCTLFEHDDALDMAQTVATVNSMELPLEGAAGTFTTEVKEITKSEFVNALNSQWSNYYTDGADVSEVFSTILDQLVNRELLLIEADRLIESGKFEATTRTQENEIWKNIYDNIEDGIYEKMVVIAKQYGEEEPVKVTAGEEPAPKYAVKTYKNEDESIDQEDWVPMVITASEELKLKGMYSYLKQLISYMDELKLNTADAAKYKAEKEYLKKYDNVHYSELVPLYADFQNLFIIKHLFYDSAKENAILTNLEKYIKSTVNITDARITQYYDTKLKEQQKSYDTDEAYIAFADSYSLDGTNVLLYNRNVQQFYVKHILIPFTEAQTAALTEKTESGKYTDEQIEVERQRAASQITGYVHVNGNDYGPEISINKISSDIYMSMTPYAGNSPAAEQKFEELIFKYNTDGGIFNNALGYSVRYQNEATTYVKEFQDAADKLYEDYLAGKAYLGSLSPWVVTQYGVHILMLSSVNMGGTLSLTDYTSPMRDQTVYDYIKEILKTSDETSIFNDYAQNIISDLRILWEDAIVKYPKRYNDVLKRVTKNMG